MRKVIVSFLSFWFMTLACFAEIQVYIEIERDTSVEHNWFTGLTETQDTLPAKSVIQFQIQYDLEKVHFESNLVSFVFRERFAAYGLFLDKAAWQIVRMEDGELMVGKRFALFWENTIKDIAEGFILVRNYEEIKIDQNKTRVEIQVQ